MDVKTQVDLRSTPESGSERGEVGPPETADRIDPGVFPRIEVVRASDVVTRSLIDGIRSGAVPQGAKLPRDQELAEHFGVSRAVIRESFDRLRHAGLIDVRRGHNGGAVVKSLNIPIDLLTERKSLDDSDLAGLLQARRAVEGMTAPLAAINATDEDLDMIEGLAGSLDAARADPVEFVEVDIHFHLRIAAASGNSQLESFLRVVFRELAVVRSAFPTLYGSMDAAELSQHATVAALRSRDPVLAARDMSRHLEAVERHFTGTSYDYGVAHPAPSDGGRGQAA
jgi:GntR family transcriptional repressor for pyruvate dehydrogenase complex